MSNDLQSTLEDRLRSGSHTSRAFDTLLDDYTRFHLVLAAAGGAVLLTSLLLTVVFWIRFTTAPRSPARRWTFEKKTYLAFGAVTTLFGAFTGLVFAANVSTVLNPRPGFANLVGSMTSPPSGSQKAQLQQAGVAWVQSDRSQVPPVVQAAIDDRLRWQGPKAVICGVLLIAVLALSVHIWRSLIEGSRVREEDRTSKRTRLATGVVTAALAPLLVIMTMANTEAALAPITITLVTST